MTPIERALAFPFFDGLSPTHSALLASHAEVSTFIEGQFIFRLKEDATAFWVILEGRVALDVPSPRGARVISTLGPEDILGFSWLFEPHEWQFDARAVNLVHAVQFDGAAIRRACEADHELGYQLMRRFARVVTARLQSTRIQALDLYV